VVCASVEGAELFGNLATGRCAEVRQCNLATEFEAATPSVTSDRVCNQTRVCPRGQFEAVAPTATTDRECGQCAAGTFVTTETNGAASNCEPCGVGAVDDDGNAATECVVCGAGHFVDPNVAVLKVGSCASFQCLAGSVDEDRNSSTGCVRCGAGAHVPAGSVGACEDFLCSPGETDADQDAGSPCEPCGPGAFVPRGSRGSCLSLRCTAGTKDADLNSTTACVACEAGAFDAGVGTAPLEACVACADETFSGAGASACSNCTVCELGVAFQTRPCNRATNRLCQACKTCAPEDPVVTPCSALADAVCKSDQSATSSSGGTGVVIGAAVGGAAALLLLLLMVVVLRRRNGATPAAGPHTHARALASDGIMPSRLGPWVVCVAQCSC
jgi:hypothetical protein